MKKEFYPTLAQYLATDTNRNLAITAGAGTGKTEVLTRRIIKILKAEKFLLNRLLVLTFTDKAAVEMKERIYRAIDKEWQRNRDDHFGKLKDSFLDNYISTFHAFCAALLREYPIEAEIEPFFRVMDETDKVFFLRRVITKAVDELAKSHNPDLDALSAELSKNKIIETIYQLIQKREHTAPRLDQWQELGWPAYREQLAAYSEAICREICFKLERSAQLTACLDNLTAAVPQPADDESQLSCDRRQLLTTLPRLQSLLTAFRKGNCELPELLALKQTVTGLCKMRGKPSAAWTSVPDSLNLLKSTLQLILSLLSIDLNLEDFQVNDELEEYTWQLLTALSRVMVYCLNSYQREKEAENLLDFQDLQIKVLKLLKSPAHTAILAELQSRFAYIMVDEFQDTNDLQWNIVSLLAAKGQGRLAGKKLFIVGDEKQAIYAFRGGDVSLFARVRRELIKANKVNGTDRAAFELASGKEKNYLQEYKREIPDDTVIRSGELVFSDNFRSAAVPVRFFNLFFTRLFTQPAYEDYEARPQQLLCSGNKALGSVELLLVESQLENRDDALPEKELPDSIDPHMKEACLIAGKIKQVLSGDDHAYERVRKTAAGGHPAIAILLNRRTKLKTYEEALRKEKIRFTVLHGQGFYQRQEIVDLGNLLSCLADPGNNICLAGFLRSPVGHLEDQTLLLLAAENRQLSLWENLEAVCSGRKTAASFTPGELECLQYAYRLLCRWRSLCRRIMVMDFLPLILDEGGYYATLARGPRAEQSLSNVEKLLEKARELSLVRRENFDFFVQWLNERIDYIDDEGEADIDLMLGGAVQLMTVHQSKGLEFPMVFVPDLAAGFTLKSKDYAACDFISSEVKIRAATIHRQQVYEIGIDVPDPEDNYNPVPCLVKKIIQHQTRLKLIAEKKRLFYVAATRTIDHLVLVGRTGRDSDFLVKKTTNLPLDHQTDWMSWFCSICGLYSQLQGVRGEIILNGEGGEKMRIPYRAFTLADFGDGKMEELVSEFMV